MKCDGNCEIFKRARRNVTVVREAVEKLTLYYVRRQMQYVCRRTGPTVRYISYDVPVTYDIPTRTLYSVM